MSGRAGPAPTVAFATLGCRLNQVDTQQMQSLLEARGFRAVDFGQPADVIVVNTCTVTARAELSGRQMIRRAGRQRARVVVTGCWAQTSPGDVAALDGVDLVIGNGDKPRLPDLLDRLLDGNQLARVQVRDIREATIDDTAPRARVNGRSRAFLKVQDGCQHRCAFCIVPFARGASRSLPPATVLAQARRLVEAGHPELVLTGVDLGHYGADLPVRTTLAALLRELVTLEGLRWLRLSSLLPAYFTDELLEVLTTSPVIAPHFHVPLQSGSDRVLRRMRRPYNVARYRRVIERLAAEVAAPGLGADVIVGFPGESDDDFAQTLSLVEALPFTYLHVFPYSPRRGTEALRLPGAVDPRVITRRSLVLRTLGHAKNLAFRARAVGTVEDVLVLDTADGATGDLVGLTGRYVEVTFPGPGALRRRLARVRVTAAEARTTRGSLIEEGA